MKKREFECGPYLIRKKTLHYGVRARYQRENKRLGIPRRKPSGGVLGVHYTVLLDGKVVESFLKLDRARHWCQERIRELETYAY